MGLRHIAYGASGTGMALNIWRIFTSRAQAAARHEVVCHVNCDIILMADFLRGCRSGWLRAERRFLMAGRRWDVDLTGGD